MLFRSTGAASILFAIPAGSLISRFGGRRAAAASVGFVLVGLLGVVLSSSIAVYALSIFVLGVGWATWRLVRFDFLVGIVGVDKRGRALSVMGGAQRMGHFVGPLLAAAAATVMGLNGAFLLHMGVAVVALTVLPARAHLGGDLLRIGENRAAVAVTAERLGGEEEIGRAHV